MTKDGKTSCLVVELETGRTGEHPDDRLYGKSECRGEIALPPEVYVTQHYVPQDGWRESRLIKRKEIKRFADLDGILSWAGKEAERLGVPLKLCSLAQDACEDKVTRAYLSKVHEQRIAGR